MKQLAVLVLTAGVLLAQPRMVELRGTSPLVTIRLVFTTGAASDPAGKPGPGVPFLKRRRGLRGFRQAQTGEAETREGGRRPVDRQIEEAVRGGHASLGPRHRAAICPACQTVHSRNSCTLCVP